MSEYIFSHFDCNWALWGLLYASAELLLYAEAKLGAMLKGSSKGTFKKGGEKALPIDIDKKQSHYAQELAGSKRIENLAKDLDVGLSDLYSCIAFAKGYQEIPTTWEYLSWREIRHNLLPAAPRPETEATEFPPGKYGIIYAGRIELGMWEKGRAISGLFRGVKNPPSYRQLERQTDRRHQNLKSWHKLYEKYLK